MGPFFTYLALLAFAIAFAKPQELEASTTSENSLFNNDLSSDINFGVSDHNDNGDDSNLPAKTGANLDTSSPVVQSSTSVGDDFRDVDLAKGATGSDEAQSIRNPSSSLATPYTVSQLGDSLFNPTKWLAKGVQLVWSTEASILNAEGSLLSGAISITGTTIYFITRRVRKLNGEQAITEEAVQSVIEQIKCPDSGNEFPFQVVCKMRLRGLAKKYWTIGHYAGYVENVIPILKDNVFNAKILEYHYIMCYCCKVLITTLKGTGFDAQVCTVQMFA